MTILEDCEHGNDPSNESYGGNTDLFSNQQTTVYNGSWSYERNSESGSSVINDTDITVSQGDEIAAYVRLGNNAEAGITFGAADESSLVFTSGFYYVTFDTNELKIADYNGDGTIGTSSYSGSTGVWYRFYIDWATDGTITFELQDTAETTLQSVTATDTSRSSGGIGFFATSGPHYYDDYTRNPTSGSPPAAPSGLNATMT